MRTLPVEFLTEIQKRFFMLVHLFVVEWSTKYYWTDCKHNVVYNGQWYYSKGIEFDKIQLSTNPKVDQIQLEIEDPKKEIEKIILNEDIRDKKVWVYALPLDRNLTPIGPAVLLFMGYCDSTSRPVGSHSWTIEVYNDMIKWKRLTPRRVTTPSCIWEFKHGPSRVQGTDGNTWVCVQDHMGHSTNKPVTGGNYLDYWQRYSYIHALLHFNGANGSQTFTDEYGRTWTAVGNAQLSTTTPKFGTAKGLFDGIGDCIYTTAITSIGSRFTIEGWFYTSDKTLVDQTVFRALNAGTYGISLVFNYNGGGSKFYLSVSSNGTTWNVADHVAGTKTDYVNGTWYKWVVEYDGVNYRLYVGPAGSTMTTDISVSSALLVCSITNFVLGAGTTAGGYGLYGGLDEVRMTFNGFRYGYAITPETAEWWVEPNDVLTWTEMNWYVIGTCRYMGPATACDKSWDKCKELKNTLNFGGFRWLPSVVGKKIWWGSSSDPVIRAAMNYPK